ncbi:MAG: MBL fold metallo-hydrolase [Gammaproteobacteria bacterium]|nr:MBL fold metallo-hydrolase [Gammaproteobacteria bacterium]MCW9005085.1 MBL fold metallo-hydrolase [Gammaproteobacteria bacterium]
MAKLRFLGAIQQVTGSCYLIETDTSKILLECGMIQGEIKPDKTPDKLFQFNPSDIDFVILSHAHLDHSGLLPGLVREGYRGSIFVTTPTHDLLDIMLKDAAFLQQKDIEWENKRRMRRGKKAVDPIYDIDDVEQVLQQLITIDYDVKIDINNDLNLCFRDAGHIIGSSIVELWINENGQTKKLVFSGDLGNSSSPLLRDPSIIENADLLLMESTYGDRNHRPATETIEEFREALSEAMDDGGNVFIPSFAVGRTQDLLYHLGQFYHDGVLGQQKVYLDSPMATSVSEVYLRHTQLYNLENPEFTESIKKGWKDWLPILTYTRSTEESMALNNISSGAIIIAGSGMCTGGRIRHHLKHNLCHRRSHILFVGFQARGTLGRALVDGAERVKFMGMEFVVNAKIHTLGGFSAHAGQDQLLDWAGHFDRQKTRLYLVHGEIDKMLALQKCCIEKYQWYANIPVPGEMIEI